MTLQHGQNLHSGKKIIKMLHGRFVHVGKTLTYLQILFSGRPHTVRMVNHCPCRLAN